MKDKLETVRELEQRLKEASPSDCARITKELVRLKNSIMEP